MNMQKWVWLLLLRNIAVPLPNCLLQPSKNELARSCKIVQESCMQDLLGTCTRSVPFLVRFLHNLAPILARSCKKCARNSKLAGNYSCSISCKNLAPFLARYVQDLARYCKNRARKGTYRVHVPCKSCMILQVRFCWEPCDFLSITARPLQ